jgi:hypothetical protein
MKALMTRASLVHVLFTALCIFIIPATSEAVSTPINNVMVTVGGVTWCITGCSSAPTGNSGAGAIWSTAAGTVITSPDSPGNHTLILTQTPNIGGNGDVFNFDTSDRDGTAIGTCSPSLPCLTVLSINGTSIPLSGGQANALANFNNDPGGTLHNEASNWNGAVFNGGPGGLIVWFGYADNAHSDQCADTTGTVASNCLPDNPWQGSPNTVFIGGTVNGVQNVGCDRPNTPNCFDGGAIRIEINNAISTPEPASVFLLGVGLIGFAALLKKRARTEA